jgi:pyridoxal phosphate enzyme (YggS family)
MAFLSDTYHSIRQSIGEGVTLIAVSKTKPVEDIEQAYREGQRDFGENYVQELLEKQPRLPSDIRWHFIGHLQSNKVKYIAPFVHMIHSVDSEKLLAEINKQAEKIHRTIPCLLQMHIAHEETKFGMTEEEILSIDFLKYPWVAIKGLMGMASFTEDKAIVRQEFQQLGKTSHLLQEKVAGASIVCMGMSGDYQLAIEEGSNMVRIGSSLFGARSYPA